MEDERSYNEGVLTLNEAFMLRYFRLISLGNVAFDLKLTFSNNNLKQLQWRQATIAVVGRNHCSGCITPLQMMHHVTANDALF